MAVNTDLENRLIDLMKNGFVKIVDIKNSDYTTAATDYFKAEVVAGTITAAQYHTITGEVYAA